MSDTPKSRTTRRFARMPRSAAPDTDRTADENDGDGHSEEAGAITAQPPIDVAEANTPAKPESKTARITELLRQEAGTTLDDLSSATGWLPHTVRAALTGLRKKGHVIVSEKVEGVRRYRITADA